MQKREEGIYRYSPTRKGFQLCSSDAHDPLREVVCCLYPDNHKSNVFDEEEQVKMELYTFRPVVYSCLSPKYCLDMHNLSGLSGYGRFVIITGKEVRWLDECDEVETEYADGEIRYCIKDHSIGDASIRMTFTGAVGAPGLIACVDCSELAENTKVYFLHGGMLSWNNHSPCMLPYCEDMCWGNVVSVHDDMAEISMDEQEWVFEYSGLKKMHCDENAMSMNCAWNILEHWKRKIIVRAEGKKMRIAPPGALITFSDKELVNVKSAWGALACAQLFAGTVQYLAVGCGAQLETGSLRELFHAARQENQCIAQKLVVESAEAVFDGAIRVGAYPTHALYGDSVLMHGALSWRYGYLGWRSAYGPLAYGMEEQVYHHFDDHFRKSRIVEGPDRGAFMHMLEEARPDAKIFYNMYETFIDQAKSYWRYTGDMEFARRLLPMVEGCIEREIRRLKPGKEWLFENSLNTWISDSHWSFQGQCTQASAYMYNMFSLAGSLTDDPEKKERYEKLAESVKEDMFRVLWQKRKGVFAYARDLSGNQLFHPEPELADVYHPAEFEVTDKYQTYQMLDWVEANLRSECLDNGGRIYWSSNWHPNAGHSYTHSTYELAVGEEMNLALTYQKLGMSEEGYELFESVYIGIYGLANSDIPQNDGDQLTAVALGFPCQLKSDGTLRHNPQFGDSISMFGRVAYEGVLGIRPMLHIGEIWLSPCLPEKIPEVTVKSVIMDYHYKRETGKVCLDYAVKRDRCQLQVSLKLPVAEICTVEVDGKKAVYQVEQDFVGEIVHISVPDAHEGCICVRFVTAKVLPVEERRTLVEDETIALHYPGEKIEALLDPQGIIASPELGDGGVRGRITGGEGSGVFFLKMNKNQMEYIRPVKVWIQSAVPKPEKYFRSYREEFAGPYEWNTIDIDGLFNAASPMEVLETVRDTVIMPPKEYSQVNAVYYKDHLVNRNKMRPESPVSDERWRSLVGENGIVMTGEHIPFRSRREGAYMAATTMIATAYPDRVKAEVNAYGRAAYLLVTGTTYPMQSHVDNLRITFEYEDGMREEYPLVNPTDIGDMWFTFWGRFHDTPATGFENMGGHCGEMSSAGLDLRKPIRTDTEAHILRFRLRSDVKVKTIEMRTIANDAVFALMGVTLLK